jgi:hypothetical protein
MTGHCVRLRLLLRQRHWQSHRTFCAEYNKAAKSIDPRLVGIAPSRAQLHRWLSGELKGLPYGDHCRILENMFPGWSARQLFEAIPEDDDESATFAGTALSSVVPTGSETPGQRDEQPLSEMRLVTSGTELARALFDVLHEAHEYLVAVGSRSQQPAYLQEIERVFEARPDLIHYRILIGPPHSQILKDHLLRLLELRGLRRGNGARKTLHIGIQEDLTHHYERFFVANEQSAVVMMPSANSHMNFDTGLIVRNLSYVQGLLQHGQALYGKDRLESVTAVDGLEVLE